MPPPPARSHPGRLGLRQERRRRRQRQERRKGRRTVRQRTLSQAGVSVTANQASTISRSIFLAWSILAPAVPCTGRSPHSICKKPGRYQKPKAAKRRLHDLFKMISKRMHQFIPKERRFS